MTNVVDEAKLEQLMGQLVGHMTGSALCFGIWLGDELGLYRTLAEVGPATADELAAEDGVPPAPRAGVARRPGRRRAARLGRRRATATRSVPEAAMALADDESPAFVARAMNAIGSMFIDMPKVAEAFRGDGALSLGRPPPVPVLRHRVVLPHRLPRRAAELDRRPRRRRRQARRRRQRRRRRLRPRRLGRRARPGVPRGAHHRLRLPRPVDRHGRASGPTEAGVVGTDDLRGGRRQGLRRHLRPDLLLRLPARHGRPRRHRPPRPRAPRRGRHRAAGRALRPRRPRRATSPATRWRRCSTPRRPAICTPNSLSQEVGLGLGAQAGEARLREVFEEAGFTTVPPGRRDAAQPHPRSQAVTVRRASLQPDASAG